MLQQVFGFLYLASVLVFVALLVYYIFTYIDETQAKQLVLEKADTKLELRRLEDSLRSLEYKSRSSSYTPNDADAYALLISRRNKLEPPPMAEVSSGKSRYRRNMRLI